MVSDPVMTESGRPVSAGPSPPQNVSLKHNLEGRPTQPMSLGNISLCVHTRHPLLRNRSHTGQWRQGKKRGPWSYCPAVPPADEAPSTRRRLAGKETAPRGPAASRGPAERGGTEGGSEGGPRPLVHLQAAQRT